jgi:hypothetical protein
MTRPFKRNTRVCALGRSLPWETILPASFFASAAACWHSPEFAPSIAFVILGLGAVFFESIAAHFSKPASLGFSLALTDSFQTFADEKNSEQTDRLLEAMANSIGRALQSSALTSTIKASFLNTLKDDDLHRATISQIKFAIKECLQDGDLHRAGAQGMISAAFGREGSNGATEGENSSPQATIKSSSQASPKERESLKL